jgi:DNA mismatch endonuclease, patch repair protein
MTDVFSKEKRSAIMSGVKSRGNLATELRLVHILRDHGIKGWRRHFPICGTPDFVFPNRRLAIFVDGCFWHGCPLHGSLPMANRAFWERKLDRNKERDKEVRRELRKAGWLVLRIWQHELREPDSAVRKIKRSLGQHQITTGYRA